MAETLKEAIITNDKRALCPHCGKLNLVINDGALVRNLRIRCRGSRRGRGEHFFILNSGEDEKQ